LPTSRLGAEASATARKERSTLGLWLAIGWAGFALLPWYAVSGGLLDPGWLLAWDRQGTAPGLQQALLHGRLWLLPVAVPLALPLLLLGRRQDTPAAARMLILCGALGVAYILAQGFLVIHDGWGIDALNRWPGPIDLRQYGIGAGASVTLLAFLMLLAQGIAARGAVNGDRFVVGSITLIVALVLAFIFFPVARILSGALQGEDGGVAPLLFVERFVDPRIWGLGCLGGGPSCGVAWNTLALAITTGAATTLLGLAFALVVTRTGFPFKRGLRALTILPIITPPFVISLAIILLFGRSGTVTSFVADLLGIDGGRWVYGFTGVLLAQVLSFTPIAFLVMIGVVEGVSPSLEEASQTLHASRWQTFTTVSLPLMRPGLANAFLLGFIESMADFGNPLVLGGNFQVLSTEIFFAIVGAQHDPGRAAMLAIVLLFFTLLAFWAQQQWLGRKSYTSVSGKGDAGMPTPLPLPLKWTAYAITIPWAVFTAIMYGMILFGGFVEIWGRDHSFTLRHYHSAFGVTQGAFGLVWSGTAWNSFATTLQIAVVSAIPTALIGLLTAWLLVRQQFGGKRAFEFGTMLSFAIPGTVIGVAYIIAFNVPPLELTGTGMILILAFVFRNMPVGVRAGIATLAQLDKSLDEASLTHRATTFQTVRLILMPLMKPALLAALVYSFVSAMTAISAVIFLVSARYELATTYILNRVENGDYGIAIAYSSVLIVVMLIVIGLFQLLIGQRRLGRRGAPASSAFAGGAG
jgi:iron(III) transport system permease protein